MPLDLSGHSAPHPGSSTGTGLAAATPDIALAVPSPTAEDRKIAKRRLHPVE